jgi:hypothetical protein
MNNFFCLKFSKCQKTKRLLSKSILYPICWCWGPFSYSQSYVQIILHNKPKTFVRLDSFFPKTTFRLLSFFSLYRQIPTKSLFKVNADIIFSWRERHPFIRFWWNLKVPTLLVFATSKMLNIAVTKWFHYHNKIY